MQLDAAKSAAFETFGNFNIPVSDLLQFIGAHYMRDRPAVRVGLIGDSLGGRDRTPKLLPPGMPQLTNKAGALAFDFCGSCLEGVLVPAVESSDDRTLRQRRRVYRQDFGDDHARAALGALSQEIDPARGNAIARAVIGQSGRKCNPIFQGAATDLQRTEQPSELAAITHVFLAATPNCRWS